MGLPWSWTGVGEREGDGGGNQTRHTPNPGRAQRPTEQNTTPTQRPQNTRTRQRKTQPGRGEGEKGERAAQGLSTPPYGTLPGEPKPPTSLTPPPSDPICSQPRRAERNRVTGWGEPATRNPRTAGPAWLHRECAARAETTAGREAQVPTWQATRSLREHWRFLSSQVYVTRACDQSPTQLKGRNPRAVDGCRGGPRTWNQPPKDHPGTKTAGLGTWSSSYDFFFLFLPFFAPRKRKLQGNLVWIINAELARMGTWIGQYAVPRSMQRNPRLSSTSTTSTAEWRDAPRTHPAFAANEA